ncbi:antibiotic biosynthesis monooxygenase family protein [Kitasatospora sp. NPDC052868]|uniref:antibiotic biosynthesis monooxygenase family protein n=1 Tax=Kitasatospora sp. NPDC052868 TaxID=3364060 RepID=UPI0037C520AF
MGASHQVFGHGRKVHLKRCCPVEGTDQYLVYTRWRDEASFQAWMEGLMKAAHQNGGEGEAPKRPAASGSTLWSFDVVQSAGPKNA